MTEMRADYYDGVQAKRHQVTVRTVGDRVVIAGDGVSADFAISEAMVRPRVGRTPQRIELSGGALLLTTDVEAVEAMLGAPREEALAHRLESNIPFVFAALIGVVIILWAGYRWGVPFAAREAAERIPVGVESQVADQVLKSADGIFLEPTKLGASRRNEISAAFMRLRHASALPESIRLEFRHAKEWIGANAFALPGGVVVVTDQLVEGLVQDRMIAAVLAHELGHIERRHSMRMLLQNSITALVAMAVFGDATSVAGVAVAFPTALVHSGYSRDFEREADRFAFDLLAKTGASPIDFADAMQKLSKLRPEPAEKSASRDASRAGEAGPDAQTGAPPSSSRESSQPSGRNEGGAQEVDRLSSYFSTHPDPEERIAAARAAAATK